MMQLWILAALSSGFSSGLLGLYIVGMRMPFLGIGMAHAAMAGAVFASLAGWPLLPCALAGAVLAGGILAWIATTHVRSDLGVITSILLSFTMGLAFLGIGMHKGGEMSAFHSLMWGSMLLVKESDVKLLFLLGAAFLVFLYFCRRPLDTLLFSRGAARSCGLNEWPLLMLFMLLAALIITINLNITGGLLMYALLTNPAAAAFELAESMPSARRWAAGLGIASTLGGFGASYALDLPTGACIVMVSTLLYAAAAVYSHQKAKGGQQR
ncbi:metal ABC transporter permease [Candidatus Sumerlaeota bacterium]|nr:metal ABC transporter permease [Candidatus Sumerlaeota bacterium]